MREMGICQKSVKNRRSDAQPYGLEIETIAPIASSAGLVLGRFVWYGGRAQCSNAVTLSYDLLDKRRSDMKGSWSALRSGVQERVGVGMFEQVAWVYEFYLMLGGIECFVTTSRRDSWNQSGQLWLFGRRMNPKNPPGTPVIGAVVVWYRTE